MVLGSSSPISAKDLGMLGGGDSKRNGVDGGLGRDGTIGSRVGIILGAGEMAAGKGVDASDRRAE